MDNDYAILFDAYLGNELPSEEKIAFETRLASDAEFRKEFDLHVSMIHGLVSYGNLELKKELQQIHHEIRPQIEQQQYSPSIHHGFNFFKWFFRLVSLGLVAGLVSSILILKDKFPVHNEKTDQYKMWLMTNTQKIFKTKVDTIYYTVGSPQVPKGDTIVSFPDKKIHHYKTGRIDTIVIRKVKVDTIRSEN